MPKVNHDGVEISYRIVGSGDRDVLLLHGWMIAGAVYDWLIDEFDHNRWRLIVPDFRGAGTSSDADSYQLDDYLEDLEAVVDDVGVTKARVVGHSMGGQIAQLFAAEHPEFVEQLVLLNPVPLSGMELPNEAHELFVNSGQDRDSQAKILKMACIELTEEAQQTLLDQAGEISEECIRASYHAWTDGADVDRLSQLQAPTLVVGSGDPFLPPELLESEVVGPIKNARFTRVKGAGHYVQVENSEETAGVIQKFFDERQ